MKRLLSNFLFAIRCVPLALPLVLTSAALAQAPFHPAPVSPRDFAIMAWNGSPSDPEVLRLMKEAGLNISGFCHAEDLDKVRDAGLTCFVDDARANGYDWTRLPPDSEIRPKIAALAAQVGNHPAALGYFLRDEPHSSLIPALGRVAAILRDLAPGKWPYVNLFPSWVSASRYLGTPDYDAYARMLLQAVHPPFLSYDNYSLIKGEMRDAFFTNLEIARRLSLENRVALWNCILANSHFNYMEPSDATFHLQVYSTLAYGGRGIQYFTYFAPEVGNYRMAAVDQFGNRTPTWDMLRRINSEIHALAPTLIHLQSTGVYHSPAAPEQGKTLSDSALVERIDMAESGLVRNPVAGRFLLGEFQDDRGRPYLMLVNKDLSTSFHFRIHLRQPSRKLIRVSPYSGQEEAFGGEMDWIMPGGGILLRVE